ncbi:MAG TPA: hypothetical protein VI454_18505 [Verrucomicrobiae bacterium]|jgi:hypothetical protein
MTPNLDCPNSTTTQPPAGTGAPPARSSLFGAAAWACAGVMLALAGSGCSWGTGQKLGEVNDHLGRINTDFKTVVGEQAKVIESQKQILNRIESTEAAVKEQQAKANTVLQRDATAVVDLLREVPEELPPRATLAVGGARIYAGNVQAAVGVYNAANRIDARKIATGQTPMAEVRANAAADLTEWYKAQDQIVHFEELSQNLRGQLTQTGIALSNSHSKLEVIQGEVDTLRRQISWERIWAYFKTPAGIVLAIALLIAFPALIPVVGWLIGHLISLFPALMSFFGLAGKGTVERVAAGVGNFKDELDKLGPAAQVSVAHVRDLLKRELLTATDSQDRRVVDHVRHTRNIS